MYDSHCHLDFPEIASSLDEHLEAARQCGVDGWLVPGCGPSQWSQLERFSNMPEVSLAVGIHPWWTHEVIGPRDAASAPSVQARVDDAMQQLSRALRQLGAVALGECGLDRAKAQADGPSLEHQQVLFEAQLSLARELRLPVVVHVVGRHGAALELMARGGTLPAGGVVHGYSGSAEMMERYMALGLSIGLGTRITSEHARRARESLQRVPLDRLLLETDAPDQAPAVGGRIRRERRGVPRDMAEVVRSAAEQRGASLGELARVTASNARRLFGLSER